jgi:hypothetical protein
MKFPSRSSGLVLPCRGTRHRRARRIANRRGIASGGIDTGCRQCRRPGANETFGAACEHEPCAADRARGVGDRAATGGDRVWRQSMPRVPHCRMPQGRGARWTATVIMEPPVRWKRNMGQRRSSCCVPLISRRTVRPPVANVENGPAAPPADCRQHIPADSQR